MSLDTFLRLPSSQWKSVRTTNAVERLHERLHEMGYPGQHAYSGFLAAAA